MNSNITVGYITIKHKKPFYTVEEVVQVFRILWWRIPLWVELYRSVDLKEAESAYDNLIREKKRKI